MGGGETVDVMGLRVSRVDVPTLRERMVRAVLDREPLTITFSNPNYVMAARKDPALRDVINGFDLNLADGWGVVLASRLLGRPVGPRMANDDLTDEFFGESVRRGWRVFLFGNAPGVADRAASNLCRWYPGLEIVGTRHGHVAGADGRIPAETERRIVDMINEAAPDVLHVGLGTPLQQWFVANNRHRLQVPIIVTCGAYFEHLAERRDYYPAWVTRLRLGWFYRLVREPRRLWRRYTLELGAYLLLLLAYRVRRWRTG
ncbi:WecB/TagA/CpsF family glycosyltransferase [Thermomonospora umbrina]|uniref:N-acetylglucosaminyldiphosphoundecaprenol N-acetyl-beta-D-mannosaminyltransferase n=1 Tax=Thermomonospora umbrina TaxID=111806 RepID=A0A3D9SUC3_9ACTN|nr:WecB/TagA/CpsF family glycosyltransferase [Thermomonospora umbrina]REE96164.1 N-acetylglucosaminyldiphosphoundecaprenol N-acetyl-beta-D-mannosaminyltransferase [Thermomonospora umbrina]